MVVPGTKELGFNIAHLRAVSSEGMPLMGTYTPVMFTILALTLMLLMANFANT